MTMNYLQETRVSCPYCGERIHVLINEEEVGEEYIEDCQVCCKPIVVCLYEDFTGELSVTVRGENETY